MNETLKTTSEDMTSDGNTNATTSGGRSDVMNDDILGLVLSHLSMKELIRLSTVSQQFLDCVHTCLERRTDVTACEMKGAFIGRQVADGCERVDDLVQSHHMFGSLLKKCPNIEYLNLHECYINGDTIELLITSCPRLKCLSFNWIHMSDGGEEDLRRMAKALSRLDSIKLRINAWFDTNFNYGDSLTIDQLTNQLSLLKRLHHNFYTKPMDKYCDEWSTPKLICCLRVKDMITQLNLNSLTQLIDGNEKTIQELILFRGLDMEENNDIFRLICDRLALKCLAFGVTSASNFDNIVFNENIVKQQSLRHLSITSGIWFNPKEMKPMCNLQVLCLNGSAIVPYRWLKCEDVFPALRHLILMNITLVCICGEQFVFGNDCEDCVFNFMAYLKRLPQLRHMRIEGEDMKPLIAGTEIVHIMTLIELRVLDLSSFAIADDIVDNLILFCHYLFLNRISRKPFRLLVNPEVRQELERQLIDTNSLKLNKYFMLQSK